VRKDDFGNETRRRKDENIMRGSPFAHFSAWELWNDNPADDVLDSPSDAAIPVVIMTL
jgi:hypothetical protein